MSNGSAGVIAALGHDDYSFSAGLNHMEFKMDGLCKCPGLLY